LNAGIELEHGGLQQPQLRLHRPPFEHLERPLHQRHGLSQFERRRPLPPVSSLRSLRTFAAPRLPLLRLLLGANHFARQNRRSAIHGIGQQRFEADELVAVLLENGRGEGLAADDKYRFPVLLELIHERNEVAIAADDGKGVHMRMREGHLQGVQRQVDVGAVFVAARGGNPLHHLYRVLRHLAGGAILPSPIRIGELGDNDRRALSTRRAPAIRRNRAAASISVRSRYCRNRQTPRYSIFLASLIYFPISRPFRPSASQNFG
jgi:hypothetical protein